MEHSPALEPTDLGYRLSQHSANKSWLAGYVFLVLCTAPVGIYTIIIGAQNLFDPFNHNAIDVGNAVIIVFGLLFVGLALLFVRLILRLWRTHLQLFSEGLFYTDGKRTLKLRWEDIQQVQGATTRYMAYGAVNTSTTHSFTLITKDDQKLVLDSHLSEITFIGDKLKKYVIMRK